MESQSRGSTTPRRPVEEPSQLTQAWVEQHRQLTSGTDRRPKRRVPVTCPRKPEKRNRETPDGHQRQQEASFGSNNSELAAIALDEQGLDGSDKDEQDEASDSKV